MAADLSESGKLAPKTLPSVGSLIRLIFRHAVKWRYLETTLWTLSTCPRARHERRKSGFPDAN